MAHKVNQNRVKKRGIMSFRDFNDEGPGTFEWDYVLGGNTTGLFPEEKHYEVDGSTLLELIFRHTGGNKYEPVYGDSWTIENISDMETYNGSRAFTFDQGTGHFRATVNEKLSRQYGLTIVDLEETD